MSLQNLAIASRSSKNSRKTGRQSFARNLAFFAAFFLQVSVKAWEVDLSRRAKDSKAPRAVKKNVPLANQGESTWTDQIASSVEPVQEIVVLHTDKGFVPETVKVKKGQSYRLHVVNVSGKDKNASFIFDAFSENHAIYFGEEKSFKISPQQEGIFSFICPETARQGRLVVVPENGPAETPVFRDRKPASKSN